LGRQKIFSDEKQNAGFKMEMFRDWEKSSTFVA